MRPDLDIVAGLVPRSSRVLDLGCGDGVLLEHLIRVRGCDGHGVEVSREGFAACVARGVPVIRADIDDGLRDFGDGSFDVVVLSQTLQATHRPALVLREMLRVGPRGVVSFPNFAHWRLRVALALGGRMPVSTSLPHAWYETPNIHLCTLHDFDDLAAAEGLRVRRRLHLDAHGRDAGRRVRVAPNLLAAGLVAELERAP